MPCCYRNFILFYAFSEVKCLHGFTWGCFAGRFQSYLVILALHYSLCLTFILLVNDTVMKNKVDFFSKKLS